MNLDVYFFNLINQFAGKWARLDYSGIFCAKYLGYVLIAILFAFLLFAFKKYWKMAALAVFSAIVSRFILTEIIRLIWFRPRPFAQFNFIPLIQQSPAEASFPSGHASFYFSLSAIVYFYNKKAGILFFIASSLIALSRVFAGIHWPSDIIAGALLGIVVAWIIFKLFKKYESRLFRSWGGIR